MFILKGIEQLEKAITKAKKIRPRVEFDCFGRYRVSGSKGYYTVIAAKTSAEVISGVPAREFRISPRCPAPEKAIEILGKPDSDKLDSFRVYKIEKMLSKQIQEKNVNIIQIFRTIYFSIFLNLKNKQLINWRI